MSENGDIALICGVLGVILAVLGGLVIFNIRNLRRRARRGWDHQVRIDGTLGGGTLVGAVLMGIGLLLLVIGVRLGVPVLLEKLFPA
jgi:uncharacterized iron-regulated membrane protein